MMTPVANPYPVTAAASDDTSVRTQLLSILCDSDIERGEPILVTDLFQRIRQRFFSDCNHPSQIPADIHCAWLSTINWLFRHGYLIYGKDLWSPGTEYIRRSTLTWHTIAIFVSRSTVDASQPTAEEQAAMQNSLPPTYLQPRWTPATVNDMAVWTTEVVLLHEHFVSPIAITGDALQQFGTPEPVETFFRYVKDR